MESATLRQVARSRPSHQGERVTIRHVAGVYSVVTNALDANAQVKGLDIPVLELLKKAIEASVFSAFLSSLAGHIFTVTTRALVMS